MTVTDKSLKRWHEVSARMNETAGGIRSQEAAFKIGYHHGYHDSGGDMAQGHRGARLDGWVRVRPGGNWGGLSQGDTVRVLTPEESVLEGTVTAVCPGYIELLADYGNGKSHLRITDEVESWTVLAPMSPEESNQAEEPIPALVVEDEPADDVPTPEPTVDPPAPPPADLPAHLVVLESSAVVELPVILSWDSSDWIYRGQGVALAPSEITAWEAAELVPRSRVLAGEQLGDQSGMHLRVYAFMGPEGVLLTREGILAYSHQEKLYRVDGEAWYPKVVNSQGATSDTGEAVPISAALSWVRTI